MSLAMRWLTILGALTVQAVIVGFGLATFTLWAGPWMSTFHASHGEIMAAIMLTQVAAGLFSPLAAQLAGRIPIRVLMLGGAVLFSASLWLVSRAGAMWQVTALYAAPIALGMVLAGHMFGQLLAVRLFQPRPGLAIGVVTLGLALGGLTLPPIAAHILAAHDWRASFEIFAAAVAAITVPVILLTIRDQRDAPAPSTDGGPAGADRALLSVGAILTDRTFFGATLVVTSLTIGFNAIYFNLGPWMADSGIGPSSTAQIISLTAIVAAGGIIGFGALADRIDVRLLLAGALALEFGGMVAAALGAGPPVLLITVPLMGFATGGLIPLLAAILAKRFGAADFARANGLSLMFTTTAVVGALLAGLGRDALGGYPAAFRLMLFTFAPGALGLLTLAAPRSVSQYAQ
jgi:MFS family permease